MIPSKHVELVVLIMTEVIDSFTPEETEAFQSFDDFFNEVDTQNDYEEDWNATYYRPFYLEVYNKLKAK